MAPSLTANRAAWPFLIAAALALALMVAGQMLGTEGLVLVAVAVVSIVLAGRPRTAVILLVALVVAIENDPEYPLTIPKFYDPIVFNFTPFEIFLGLAVVAVALDATVGRGIPSLPAALLIPIGLLCAGILAGAVVAADRGVGLQALTADIRTLAPLVVLPLLIPFVVRNREEMLIAMGVGGALAAAKSAEGTLLSLTGSGIAQVSGPAIAFYEPVGPYLAAVLGLTAVGALMRRVTLPVWVWVAAPMAIATLVLSYRRSFWVAFVVALLVVLVAGSGRVGRRLLVPAAVVVAFGVYTALSTGVVTDLQGPVVKRVESLSPERLVNDKQDRYRLDERRNVLAEMERHPITGLGWGGRWEVRYPLSRPSEGQNYAHASSLYLWMKMGALGLLAYAAYGFALIALGLAAARRHADTPIGVGSLALASMGIGMLVAELTAAFTGADQRYNVLLGVVFGLLVVAARIPSASSGDLDTIAGR